MAQSSALLASLLVLFAAVTVDLVSGVVDCTAAQQAMFPCLSAAVGSNPPPPSAGCCSAMRNVSRIEICQCLVNQTSAVPGLNMTAARNIPTNCNITTDPQACSTT